MPNFGARILTSEEAEPESSIIKEGNSVHQSKSYFMGGKDSIQECSPVNEADHRVPSPYHDNNVNQDQEDADEEAI